MPIVVKHPIRRPTETEFAGIAYEVMGCVFAIHNEFGLFFDERIYKRDAVATGEWQNLGEPRVWEWFIAFVRDVGTCLDISLHEEALTHRLGGEQNVERHIEVVSGEYSLGSQTFRLIQPDVAFKVTTLNGSTESFAAHARRLLAHVKLSAIQWINVARHELTFTTLHK